MLAGIALYNPAMATTISRTSSTLFIGGVSFAHTAARGEVYAESTLREQHDLWIMSFLVDVRCELLELGLAADGMYHLKGSLLLIELAAFCLTVAFLWADRRWGNTPVPKRCSTTFVWTAHIDITWGMGFDLCPLQTIESKKQYYAQAILENWLTVFTHDPAIPEAYVEKDEIGKMAARKV